MRVKFENLVKIYNGEKFYQTCVCGLKRDLPIRRVDEDLWIASNHQLVLGRDVEFTKKVAEELSKIIRKYNPDCLFTAEAKSLPLVYKISELLDFPSMLVARKGVKSYMEDSYIDVTVKSITTARPQKLILEYDEAKKMKDKKIAIVDDAVSTGGTLSGLEELVREADGIVSCKVSIWKEGPWYRNDDLIYLSILPVFVTEKRFKEMERLFGDDKYD
jgi:adenine phosphoribosyltransferase